MFILSLNEFWSALLLVDAHIIHFASSDFNSIRAIITLILHPFQWFSLRWQ
jgi:hypothetical protein